MEEEKKKPRVLICCVTYDGHGFCFESFYKALKNLKYEHRDILFIDTSDSNDYISVIRSQGFNAVKLDLSSVDKDKERISKIVEGRRLARKEFLDGDYEFLFFLDTDIIAPEDAIDRLMAINKKLVSGIYPHRKEFNGVSEIYPVLYDFDKEGSARLMTMNEVVEPRVIEVNIAGLGCCLIAREIIEKIDFRSYGELKTGGEDVAFFLDALEKGYKAFADTGVKCLHMTQGEVLDFSHDPTYSFSVNVAE